MAIMKYKENGEWKELPAVVNTIEREGGGFTYDFVERASNTTYDLSSYVAPGADFMIMFIAAANGTDSTSPIYVWIKSDGVVRTHITGSNVPMSSYLNFIFNWFDEPMSGGSDNIIEVSYDEATCIFSVVGQGEKVGELALLFHA